MPKQRLLGSTGIKVSEIAFGGVEIGMPYGIGVKNSRNMLSQREAIVLLHTATESGINFFDTARAYGESESVMGKAFKDRRSNIILCTKCKLFRNPDGTIPNHAALQKAITTSLKESLLALRTDYADIFMLHQAETDLLENDDVCTIFSSLKKSGIIRATGVSTYSPEETKKAITGGIWDVIQLPFNLMDQRQSALFALAAGKGIGIVIRSVLLKGILTYRGRQLHSALKNVEAHLKQYDQLLENAFPDLATLAIKFALSFNEISTTLVGIDKLEYLYKSLEIANNGYLDKETMAMAKRLCYPDPEFLNLRKWDQMGWLK